MLTQNKWCTDTEMVVNMNESAKLQLCAFIIDDHFRVRILILTTTSELLCAHIYASTCVQITMHQVFFYFG